MSASAFARSDLIHSAEFIMRAWTAAGLGGIIGFGTGMRALLGSGVDAGPTLPWLGATTVAGMLIGLDLRFVRQWVTRFGMWGWYGCLISAAAPSCSFAFGVFFGRDDPAAPWYGALLGLVGGLCWGYYLRDWAWELRCDPEHPSESW